MEAVPGNAVERLRRAGEIRSRAEIDEALAIAELAAEHAWDEDATFDVVGTRPVRIGADGTALVDEFLPLEVAAVKGISVGAATWLIRDVVNLKARHPLLWMMVGRGVIPVFRACQLGAEVARFDLSLEEAQELDLRLAPKIGGLPWRRVLQLVRGLITELAAEKVAALARRARADRFVRKLPTDDPTVAYLSARLDTADAIFLDAMVDRIADILGERGDTDTKEIRRAKALGVLATPERARLMLVEATEAVASTGSANDRGSASTGLAGGGVASTGSANDGGSASTGSDSGGVASTGSANDGGSGGGGEAATDSANDGGSANDRGSVGGRVRSTDPRLLPRATVYVHVAEETLLTGRGTARVEGVGPLAATMLKLLLGNCRITLAPVIRPYADVAVDSYEVPDRIRNQVLLRDPVEVFPYSTRSARKQDLDHTVPYRPGVKGQTRAANLGPLSRKAHRGKTHGGWQLAQPRPGIFWWTSPSGHRYRVGPNGTRPYHPILWQIDHASAPDDDPPSGENAPGRR